ncbi:MAG TPA: class I SAM-dependent RNA methyltransferase, partial [Bacteroidales bacterium]|nr:class I SAM-dependent RNA methyltransferase [Bacteroidales bacterium]
MSENNFTIVAKTMAGLESVLAEELKALGAKNIVILPRAVSFYGDKKLLYKANLWTRTALRILKFIKTFNIQNEQDIYKGVYSIDWEEWLSVDNTLAIDTVINNSFLTHSVFVSQKAKDAIVDQFRHKTGRRPSISLDNPDLRLNIYISGNNCTLSADSSGESLHKRGYRKFSLQAPINEVLAAGLIKLAGWNGNSNFVDPMCGSGTIVIEAALIALNIPPSYYRKIFGFEKWKDFEPDLWNSIKDKVPSLINNDIENEIIGADISPKAISIAKENIKSVGLQKKIKL